MRAMNLNTMKIFLTLFCIISLASCTDQMISLQVDGSGVLSANASSDEPSENCLLYTSDAADE